MTRPLLLLLLLLFSAISSTMATHIVGGEIQLSHRTDFFYDLALVLYFDDVNGNPEAIDDSVVIYAFSKSTNQLVGAHQLPRISRNRVNYTNPSCAVGALSTSRVYYEDRIFLDPADYSEPEGYYLVYERCCRNGVIQNIFDPGGAGQAFYLEFPAVQQNGQPFVNSSPQLFPPLSDYAALGKPFFFDFGGTDPDGDSLVYSLSTPLNGFSSRDQPLPPPTSGPYSEVRFLPSYDLRNMIQGTPPLAIDPATGFITITASELGLFVFAVKCEEFRDGEKIGEVRRDFQMLVLEVPNADPPRITEVAEAPRESISIQRTLTYEAGLSDNCFEVKVSDPNFDSQLSTTFIPISHPQIDVEVRGETNPMVNPGDSASFQVCLKECPVIVNGTYEFLLLVGDNSCAVPLFDTVAVSIDIFTPNIPPQIDSDLTFNPAGGFYEGEILVGDSIDFQVFGEDPDGDDLILEVFGDNFNLQDLGMQFSNATGSGEVSASFFWAPECQDLPTAFREGEYWMSFVVGDIGQCGIMERDTVRVRLSATNIPEPNDAPFLTATGLSPEENGLFCIELEVGQSLEQELIADDIDGDFISITALGATASLDSLGIVFEPISGPPPLNFNISWVPSCEFLNDGFEPAEFLFEFVVRDQNECEFETLDTLQFKVSISDVPRGEAVAFPNAFTPNNDGFSELFSIGELPPDNCDDTFQSIRIFNRWGEEVYFSDSRDFAWDGSRFPAGTYFYVIDYQQQQIKGSLSLITDDRGR